MEFQFHGAAGEVTGSCHQISVNGKKILLDYGLLQGKRKEAFERNRKSHVPVEEIDAIILSHAHIDHSGNLPSLVRAGYEGPIYATSATVSLCEHMLRDSAFIQEKDVEYVNKKRLRKKQKPFEPLYTREDAEQTLALMKRVDYDDDFDLFEGIKVRFEEAGHILGSASVHLTITEKGKEHIVVFTGDVGRRNQPILKDPTPPRKADFLICESTYGNRLHEADEDVQARLLKIVKETDDAQGKLLIPAFSLGRTQRLVYDLHQLFREGKLPPVPIYVDSPLAVNVTEVYRNHPECYDRELEKFNHENDDAFGFYKLNYTESVEESMALNSLKVSCIIIAASGMCEGGRVLHHLKHVAPHPKNTILLVGFMAEHTLGRRIEEEREILKIYGDEYPLRAKVEQIRGLSGHADRDELVAYLGHLKKPPKKTFLIHGEKEAQEAFAQNLFDFGFPKVEIPVRGQKFKVT